MCLFLDESVRPKANKYSVMIESRNLQSLRVSVAEFPIVLIKKRNAAKICWKARSCRTDLPAHFDMGFASWKYSPGAGIMVSCFLQRVERIKYLRLLFLDLRFDLVTTTPVQRFVFK
jgi:hypothetical protein